LLGLNPKNAACSPNGPQKPSYNYVHSYISLPKNGQNASIVEKSVFETSSSTNLLFYKKTVISLSFWKVLYSSNPFLLGV